MKFRSDLRGFGVLLAVSMLFTGCGRGTGDEGRIQINGSDTEVNLVQNLAEHYMSEQPDVRISVTGGGSGTGIAAIINQQTDIANSSRSMRDSEIEQARRRGVEPVGTVFAMDGLAVIVNENVGIEELTLEQVGRIYRGEIANWQELGGPNQEISLYGRQSNSGTYIYFRDEVVHGDYAPGMRNMNGTAQIVEGVRTDRAAIGYVGIGYITTQAGETVSGVRVVRIARAEGEPYVTPMEMQNVMDGSYPISRPLYQYTDGVPTGSLLDFIRWELSEEGQRVVAESGYYPVNDEYMDRNRALGIVE